MNKDEQIIKKYHSILTDAVKYKDIELNKLWDKKNELIIELDISVRMWHKIEEEYIRYKLESIIDMIDILNNLELNNNKLWTE